MNPFVALFLGLVCGASGCDYIVVKVNDKAQQKRFHGKSFLSPFAEKLISNPQISIYIDAR